MTIKNKLTAMSALLVALCFPPHAFAEPQDNLWLRSEWQTGLSGWGIAWSYEYCAAFNTNEQVIVGGKGLIRVYETNGTLLRTWSASATDLDVSTNGLIFAAGDGKVAVYTVLGNLVNQWSLANAWGIAVTMHGLVYVSGGNQGMTDRVFLFDSNGTLLRQWGGFGSAPGLFNTATDVAVTDSGEVYVCDKTNGRIQIFDSEGTYRRQISYGSAWPYRFAVSPDNGLVIVDCGGSACGNPGSFSRDGQLQCAITGPPGSLRVYRRTYSTTGLRPHNAVPIPTILKTQQRVGTTLVEVDFTVRDPDNPSVNVAAVAFINGQTNLASLIPMRTFEEGTGVATGTNVATSVNHRLTWNAAADWSTNFVIAQVEILAKDNRGLMDFHFLTIPIPTNLPPLTISQFPINNADFLNMWVWLVASGNTNILLTNGTVMGLSGAYNGKALTSNNGTVTTADGRSFLFSLLNVREATLEEYNRAKGSGVKWTPRVQLAGRPVNVNEFGFDTGAATANNYWVVPVP